MSNILKNFFQKLSSNKYEFFLTFYLVINVIWIFFGMFLYNYFYFSYRNISVSYVLLFVFNVFIIFFLNVFKKIKFDKIDIFLILLVIFGIIASVFAKNISVSLYGYWKRYEGMFQIFYYYSLMYLSSLIFLEKNKKLIIRFILLFGVVNSFICFLQVFDVLKFIPIVGRGIVLGQGLVTNSNFFGSYMVICIGITAGIYLYDNKRYNFLFLILCLCFFSGLLMSNALSCMVGFFFIVLCIIFYLIYLIIKKQVNRSLIIKYVLLLISLLTVNYLLIISGKTVMNKDIRRFTNETRNIVSGNFDDSYGSLRMYIWKNTMRVVPKYLVHGVGIDNFSYAFGDNALVISLSDSYTYFDKAHNEYLQKLVCEGLFSLMTYIGFLFIIFVFSINNVMNNRNYITTSLFLAFVGYCIQAFFNISVIEVAPLFFLVCGLLYKREYKVLFK